MKKREDQEQEAVIQWTEAVRRRYPGVDGGPIQLPGGDEGQLPAQDQNGVQQDIHSAAKRFGRHPDRPCHHYGGADAQDAEPADALQHKGHV